MAIPLAVPKMGLTMTKGVVTQWVVAHGAHVRAGDVVYVLTTDKTDAEIEADGSGILHQAVALGATVKPGEAVGYLLEPGEAPPAAPAAASPGPGRAAARPPAGGAQPGRAIASAPAAPVAAGGRRFSSPHARRLAGELGVDLRLVAGTGPNGRVIGADVTDAHRAGVGAPSGPLSPLAARLAARLGVNTAALVGSGPAGRIRLDDVIAAASAAPAQPVAPARQPVPITGAFIRHDSMRRAIAARMHQSLQEMAQLTLTREVGVDAMVGLRSRLRDEWPARGWAVPSITDLVLKATAIALTEHPRLNATYDDDYLVLHEAIDLGMAVSLDNGLVVPVVRNVIGTALHDLPRVTSALAARARAGELGLDDYADPTFTVTALGGSGIDAFTPVVNPPNVAILGVGRIKDSTAWDGETPRRTQVMVFSLTIDHRIIDGAPGAAFLQTLAEVLADPDRLVG